MRDTRNILLIVFMLSSFVFADPMGTAFTYQGRLNDDGDPAEGVYDFVFELYESPIVGATAIGTPVSLEDVEVTGGYFTVKIDFGVSMFTGESRWLSIKVRPGDSPFLLKHATLSPRQEITPTPNAIYAATAGEIIPPVYLGYSGVETVIELLNSGPGYGLLSKSQGGIGIYGKQVNSGN